MTANKDTTGIGSGTIGQTFVQDEKVMIRRLGDGYEYRAKVAGIAIDNEAKVVICEIIDPFNSDYAYSHIAMTEACIDKENWED